MMEKIKVSIVDSNSLFRKGLCDYFSQAEEIEVVSDSDFIEDVLSLVEGISPNVLLMDIDLPALRGLSVALQVRQRTPSVSVIIMTPYEDEEQIFQAVKAGAAGLISNSTAGEELVQLIRQVYQGENLLNEKLLAKPRVAERVLKQFQEISLTGKNTDSLTAPLSPREVEILKYVAQGYGNKTIALVLGISEQTIKNHITSILRKLAANDRTHAVVLALRHGLISVF